MTTNESAAREKVIELWLSGFCVTCIARWMGTHGYDIRYGQIREIARITPANVFQNRCIFCKSPRPVQSPPPEDV